MIALSELQIKRCTSKPWKPKGKHNQHSDFLDEDDKVDSNLKEISLKTIIKEALNDRVGNFLLLHSCNKYDSKFPPQT